MANKPLNAVDGYSVGPNANIQVIYANGDISTGNATLSGNLVSANANLGNTAYANFFLGDGGLLSNLPSGEGLANGNSSVTIPVANGNILVSVAGNANVVTFTGTGMNVAGTGNFTGNLRAANIQGNFANGNSNIRIPSSNGNILFSAAGNANVVFITGNGLIANGQFAATDPVIELGGLANGAPLTSNDGKDRGVILNYYNGFSKEAFMGWTTANGEFSLASEAVVTNDVVTIYALGNVRAGYFLGNVLGNIEGNIVAPGANTEVLFNDDDQINASPGFTFNKSSNALTITGNFSAAASNVTGYANAGNFYTPGNLQVLGTANVGELFTGGNVNAVGNLSGLNIQAGGNISAVGNINGGNLSTSGQANVTGTVNAGNVYTAGNLTAVGNSSFTGNSQFGNAAIFDDRLTVGNPNAAPRVDLFSNGYLRAYNLDVSYYGSANSGVGNLTARDISVSTANIGTLNISQNILAANAITANFITANANLTSGNANLGNLAKANFFQGDGWLLTNLTIPAGSAIENGNSNVRVEPNANVVFSIAGTNAVATISTNGFQVNGAVNATGNINASGNITGGNIIANSSVYTEFIRDGNSVIEVDGVNEYIRLGVNAASNRFFVDATGAAVNGNLAVSGRSNISGNLNVSGTTNVQALNTTTINANGNITALNANLGNLVSANFFAGDGYLLTNLTIAAGSAIVNGNSNVTVAPNANVSVSVGGTDNVTTFTSNSVVVNQLLNVNANANVANWVNANALRVSGTALFYSDLTVNNSTITSRYVNIGNNSYPGYLDVNGNVNFDNRLTVGGTANFSGIIQVNGTIYSNANIQADDYLIGNYLTINKTGNIPNLNVSNIANINDLVLSGNFTGPGNISVTGNLAAGNANLGNLAKANFFQGDGYLLTNLTITAGSSIINGNSNVLIVANGNVNTSVAGNANVQVVTGTGVNIAGYLNATGNITGAVANFSGNISIGGNANITNNANIGGNLTVSNSANITGNITAGNANLGNYVYANFFEGDGSLLTNLTIVAGNSLLNGNSNVYVEYSGNINFRANGVANAFQVGNTFSKVNGNLIVTDSVNAESYANGTSNLIIRTNSDVTVSAGGTANVLVVTNLGANVNGTLRAIGNLSVTGNANTGNLGVGGLIQAGGNISGGNLNTGGNLSVSGVANIATISSPGEISASGNITSQANLNGARGSFTGNLTAANANLGNLVTANFFSGNGSLLTGVSATILANGTSNVDIPVANGNVTVSVSGNSNVLVVTGQGLEVDGNIVTGSGSGGSITGANLLAANTINANAAFNSLGVANLGSVSNVTITGGSSGQYLQTNGSGGLSWATISTSGVSNGTSNVSIPVVDGNINMSVAGNANVLVVTGTGINVAGTSNTTGNIIGGGELSISGNAVVGGNLTVDGNLIYINVTDLSVEDPIIQLQTGPNAAPPTSNSGKDVGLALNYYDTAARIAFMGWDVSNAEIAFGSQVSISGEVVTFTQLANIRSGNAQLGNLVTANFVSGTLTTAAQPNITSVGTLNSLAVTGNVTAGNVYANSGTIGASLLTGTLTTSAQPNVTSVGTLSSLAVTGNVTAGNANLGNTVSANFFVGNGSGLTGISAVSATYISNGNSNVNIPAANGNVTVSVSGNSNVFVVTGTGANITGSLDVTGNITAGNFTTSGSAGNITGANVITACTFIGNTGNFSTALNVTGLSNLGPVGNVTITGGSSGQYLQTNGSGVLSWATISTSSISNGNSNVNIPAANGNVNISAAGNANIIVVTGTGANIAGTLNVTGNANAGNIGATGGVFTTVAGTLTTAAQPNITSLGTLSSLAVTSNITAGNVYANSGTIGASLLAGTLTTAAQPNITSVGTLGSLTVTGNVTAGNILGVFANGNSNVNIPAANGNVNISAAGNANIIVVTGTGANITGNLGISSNLAVTGRSNLGAVGNVIITGGTANYVLSTDGAGNLSWVAQSGGSGTPGGTNTQVQFNDANTFAGNAGFTFNKTTTTVTANNFVATSTANLGAVGNVTITGGTNGLVLVTNGAGGLNWGNVGTAVTVDSFIGSGSQTAFTLSTIPANVNYTLVSLAGTFQPRDAYTLAGNVLTFTSAPPAASGIEVTTLAAATYAGPNTGTFINRTYTGDGANVNYTVTNGVTADSVVVTENGIVQSPGTDYTVGGATLTFTSAPASGVAIGIREIPASGGGASNARVTGYSLVFGG